MVFITEPRTTNRTEPVRQRAPSLSSLAMLSPCRLVLDPSKASGAAGNATLKVTRYRHFLQLAECWIFFSLPLLAKI